MLTNIKLPTYARRYSLDETQEAELEKKLGEKNQAISLILQKISQIPSFQPDKMERFEEEWEKVDKKMTSDHTWLSYYFLICMDRVGKVESNTLQILKKLFNDLEQLPNLVYHYLDTQSPDTKHKIMILTQPYQTNMRQLIVSCKEIFGTEESDIDKEIND